MILLTLYFFFFNDTATTEIYTLSLHDALPISDVYEGAPSPVVGFMSTAPKAAVFAVLLRIMFEANAPGRLWLIWVTAALDRKSTRLNSSHLVISYAVFCLKKKKHSQYTYSWKI